MPQRRLISRVFSAWRNLVHHDRAERELDDEMRAAFDLLVEEKVRDGLPPADARRAATLELGGVESVKEQVRAARTGAGIDTFLRDIRYAARRLRHDRLLALTAALSLSVGIGANTAIFTIANALLFRAPAGVSDQDRLLDISRAEEGKALANFTVSYPYYLDVRQRATTLAGLYAYEFEPQAVSLRVAESTELAFANLVTGNYFAELGVIPTAGRLLMQRDDEQPGAHPVVVLSHRYWTRRFNADPRVVGQVVQINRHPFTVIGVGGEGFRGTNVVAADLWAPMSMAAIVQPGTSRLTSRRSNGLGMGGRLKPGVSMTQAAAELDAIALALERENPSDERGTRLRVAALTSMPGPTATVAAGFFALLLALVSVVLVIACVNLAGLLLARAVARRREIAVRMAIGAGRARLVQQLLTETLLLFVLGGSAGVLLARGMTSLLLSALPAFPVPVDVSLPLDGRVLVFTSALTLVAAALCGLAPALHVSKSEVVAGLKDEPDGPPERMRLRHAFVIVQLAFSIMLVVIAGLLVRALDRLGSIDQGFDPRGVEVAPLDLTRAGYTEEAGALFARDLVDRLRSLPGADAVTLSEHLPGRGVTLVGSLTVPGVSPPDGQPSFTGISNTVDTNYFATLGIPLLAGRDFSAADHAGAQPVVIVSQTTGRMLWPGQDPVGKYLVQQDVGPEKSREPISLQVIGVAQDLASAFGGRAAPSVQRRDVRGGSPQVTSSESLLTMYVPLQQRYTPRLTILARAAGGRRLASEIREVVKSMDPTLAMMTPQTLDSQSGPVHLQLRIAASVAGTVGLIGLFLAAIGIYGVTAYATARRTREIGIRMAMGAEPHVIVKMVLRQGMSLVAIGAGIGLTLAAAGSQLFAGLLFGMPPLDPATYGGTAALFATIGLAACYLPARRATRIAATEALRYE